MSNNEIEKVRKHIREYFDETKIVTNEYSIFESPHKDFKVNKTVYRQNIAKYNWNVSKIEIVNMQNETIFSTLIDDDHFFHNWISIDKDYYLFFSENLCGGYSFYNCSKKQFFSYSDGTDGFICTSFFISPDSKKLAVPGCVWAGPYFVRIFDISSLDIFPWPILNDIQLDDNAEDTEISWATNNSLLLYKIGKEKTLSREVNIS